MTSRRSKIQLVRILEKAGLFALNRRRTVSRIRALLYHRFGEGEKEGCVSRKTFRKQILYASKKFRIIQPDRLFKDYNGGYGVVITVDDGYLDFYEHAYPILRMFQVPAIVYLTTGFIDRETWLWFDKVEYIMQEAVEHKFPFTLADSEWTFRRVDLPHLLGWFKGLSVEERDSYVATLSEKLGVHLPEAAPKRYAPMDWHHVREMAENGIAFGSHTCTHPILNQISSERAFPEINTSKERIEAELGKPVVSFAYPNGDYNEKTVQMVREAGYEYAFTTRYGFVSLKDSRFTLNRMAIGDRPLIYFRQDLSGIDILKESTRRFFRLNR